MSNTEADARAKSRRASIRSIRRARLWLPFVVSFLFASTGLPALMILGVVLGVAAGLGVAWLANDLEEFEDWLDEVQGRKEAQR